MIDQETQQYLNDSVLCWLATVDNQGQPSVSPKEIFDYYDPHHIIVAHIASPKTIHNISIQPKVCLSVVDILKQKGKQLYGSATVLLPDHQAFDIHAQPLLSMTGGLFPIKAVIKIRVTHIKSIIAPSYWLNPSSSEAEHIEEAKKQYNLGQ